MQGSTLPPLITAMIGLASVTFASATFGVAGLLLERRGVPEPDLSQSVWVRAQLRRQQAAVKAGRHLRKIAMVSSAGLLVVFLIWIAQR